MSNKINWIMYNAALMGLNNNLQAWLDGKDRDMALELLSVMEESVKENFKVLEADRKRLRKVRANIETVFNIGIKKRDKIRQNLAGTVFETEKLDIMIDTWRDILDLIDEPLKEADNGQKP